MKQQLPRLRPMQWLLIGGALLLLFVLILPKGSSAEKLDVSRIIPMAEAGQISKIQVRGDKLTVTDINGKVFKSRKEGSVSILELLEQGGISTDAAGIQVEVLGEGGSFFGTLLSFLPLIIFGGFILFMIRGARGGMNQAMGFGRSKAKLVMENRPTVTFDDVAGADEVKQELAEIVEILRYPGKFTRLGAKIPKGVLLVGSPGTGKTLVSKAVAGTARVPFYSISGSEFVEMFVGVGASRVRDLFAQAKAAAPAIIFIDEIDAVGRHRGAGIGGGNDEREQTLNQILVEMDGFDERSNVIVIAATNRPDVLDPALLRPGRFDHRVVMDLPDVKGREAILKVHLKGKVVLKDVDIPTMTKQTHGFSGADLANVVNEAAILAAREDKDGISLLDLEEAVDRVIGGPARKSRQISPREKEIIAYHEAGQALLASQLPAADPVHKVTIIGRGSAGGYTRMLPEEDRSLWSKTQFEAMLAVMMGGQAAEEIVFGDITTGASSDLQNANGVARKMVTEYGMSGELGPRTFDSGNSTVFLGKELREGPNYSEAVAEKIDSEISSFLRCAQERAKQVIEANRAKLTLLANKLLVDETVEGAELLQLLGVSAEDVPLAA